MKKITYLCVHLSKVKLPLESGKIVIDGKQYVLTTVAAKMMCECTGMGECHPAILHTYHYLVNELFAHTNLSLDWQIVDDRLEGVVQHKEVSSAKVMSSLRD